MFATGTPSEKPKEPKPAGGGTVEVPKVEEKESVPVQGVEEVKGEEVKPVRGSKQVARSLQELDEAKDEISAIDAIHKFDSNVSQAPDAATPKEKGRIENAKKELADKGYEIGGHSIEVGKEFNQGMQVVVSSSIPDDNLEEGREVISKIVKPAIFKDGKMVRAATIQVSVGTKQSEQVAPETIVPPKVLVL